jgi:hypothetical protein
VISTAGDATLSVADPSSVSTGHLVNGAFALPQPLQAKAHTASNPGAALAAVGSSAAPTTLLTWAAPASNDAVTLDFSQRVDAADALRTGTYAQTLTFTLSTNTRRRFSSGAPPRPMFGSRRMRHRSPSAHRSSGRWRMRKASDAS